MSAYLGGVTVYQIRSEFALHKIQLVKNVTQEPACHESVSKEHSDLFHVETLAG